MAELVKTPRSEHEQKALDFKKWLEEKGKALGLFMLVETTIGEYSGKESLFQTVVLIRCTGQEIEVLTDFGKKISQEAEKQGARIQFAPGISKNESSLPPLKRSDVEKLMGVKVAAEAETVKPWVLDAEFIFR